MAEPCSLDGESNVSVAGQSGLAPKGIVTYSFRTRSFDRLTDFGEFPVWLADSRRVMFVSGGKDGTGRSAADPP
jgi:hypothetical protein